MKNIKITFLLLCFCILNSFESVSALTLVNKSTSQNRRGGEHFINPQEVLFNFIARQ